jgi:mannitol-specific phosphotransferase system IIBC component
MNFKLPRNIISNNIFKNVLYLVTSALAVSYIINEQSLALLSLRVIACGVYVMNKSIVIALLVSIIITNLLLSMNYLKEYDVIEGLESKQPKQPKQPKQRVARQSSQEEPEELQEPEE